MDFEYRYQKQLGDMIMKRIIENNRRITEFHRVYDLLPPGIAKSRVWCNDSRSPGYIGIKMLGYTIDPRADKLFR